MNARAMLIQSVAAWFFFGLFQVASAEPISPVEALGIVVSAEAARSGKSPASLLTAQRFGAAIYDGSRVLVLGRSENQLVLHLREADGFFSRSSDGGKSWTKWAPVSSFQCATDSQAASIPTNLGTELTGSAAAINSPSSQSIAVDVLVGYTPAVLTQYGGGSLGINRITADALAATAYLNHSLDVSQTGVYANLVGLTQFDHSELASNNCGAVAENALNWLESSPAVANLRDAYFADIVYLFFSGPDCGVTRRGGFSVSGLLSYNSAASIETFAHEVGHELGANHARDQGVQPCPSAVSCGYWQHETQPLPRYQDFMTYAPGTLGAPCSNCRIYPIFSSPGLNYPNGASAGTATDDNVAAILQFAPLVSARRTFQPPQAVPLPGGLLHSLLTSSSMSVGIFQNGFEMQ